MPDARDADDGCVGQARRGRLRSGERRQRIEAARDEERRNVARDGLAHVFDGLAGQDACVAEVRIRGYSETPPEDWNGAYALLTK